MLPKVLIALLPVLATAAPYAPYAPVTSPTSAPQAPTHDTYGSSPGYGPSSGNGGDDGKNESFQPIPPTIGDTENEVVSKVVDFEEYAPLLGLRDAGLTAQGTCANNISPIGPLIPELQITGVETHGDNFGVFGPIRNILNGGKPAITVLEDECPGAKTDKFDLDSLCFACAVVVLEGPVTGLAKSCELSLQGYDADGEKTESAGPFKFKPRGLNNDLVCVDVGLKGVSKVVPSVKAGLLGLVVSGIIDDVKVTYTKHD